MKQTKKNTKLLTAFESVDLMMKQALSDGVFYGAVALVSKGPDILFHGAYGNTDQTCRQAVTLDTVFDLASLTKPLATTMAVMKLVEGGILDLDARLASILPAFRSTDKSRITIKQLLAHTSGLPDYRPYYIGLAKLPPESRRAVLLDRLVQENLDYPVGSKTVYSDLGFMILARVAESAAGDRLDRFVDREIYGPLKCRDLFFIDLAGRRPAREFAATEDCPWRQRVLRGEVHDDNAWVLGGIDGHAGLFGTAAGVHRVLTELLSIYGGVSGSRVLSTGTLQCFFHRNRGQERALGFDVPAEETASCGRHFSTNSVGHLGFTGTSFWMDLDAGVSVILLTNRVHPSRENTKIRKFRPKLHDAVMESLQKDKG